MKKYTCFLFVLLSAQFSWGQTKNTWFKQANFPGGLLEKTVAFSAGNNGFAGSGTDRKNFQKIFWKYNAGKDSWEQTERFPGQARISAAAFSIGDKGYVGTGMAGTPDIKQETNDLWEYDVKKNSWTQKANFPGGIRSGAVGFAINGKGYFALGANATSFYNDLWEYDPASNQWARKADFPEKGKVDASAFCIGEEAYVMFGQKKDMLPLKKTCWKYSPAKNEWKQFADFPGAERMGAITFSYKNKGYAIGGSTEAVKEFQDFWEYDAATDKWLAKEEVPFGKCAYGFAFLIDGAAYVSPGKTITQSRGVEFWKYDIEAKPPVPPVVNTIVIGGSLLFGDERIPLAGIEVKLLNTKNQVVKSVFSNLFGSFLFSQVPENEDLILTFDVNGDRSWVDHKFYIVNRKDEDVAILRRDNDFKLYLSSANKNNIQLVKVENKNLRMNMKGKLALDDEARTPLANVPVLLINDEQEIVQGGTTNDKGDFLFTYLPIDSSVYLSIDKKVAASLAKGNKILLMDDEDQVVSKTNMEHPEFQHVNVASETNSLSQVYMEDSWLEPVMSSKSGKTMVVERIYFDYDQITLPETKMVLNKAVAVLKSDPVFSIEISAHTDSRGDAKYNMELSEKRAAAAKEYMVAKGVNPKQIQAKGYGETMLINRCADGVSCSEEEHAENRRMEFVIKRK